MNTSSTRRLIERLKSPDAYPHDTTSIKVVETHISFVILTGDFAYKIKKPVCMPFVDFSSIEKRKHFCNRELQLNRQFASEIYLDVVTIGGSVDAPVVGANPPIEYAVKMRQFDAEKTADALLDQGELTREALTALAKRIALFHDSLSSASGSRPTVAMDENLSQFLKSIRRNLDANPDSAGSVQAALSAIRDWTTTQGRMLSSFFAARERNGLVRKCHGDLHLRNIALVDGELKPFDCLEFDDLLSTIDIIDEVAFLAMDLIAHGRSDLAFRFVNSYLQETGDYDSLRGFFYYCVHRALVRAKVEYVSNKSARSDGWERFVSVATRLTNPRTPVLLITVGLSGSGKTTVTDELIERLPAIRIRSDIERKRAHGLVPTASSKSSLSQGIYTDQATHATYDRLHATAMSALEGRINVIVDASFLQRTHRSRFLELAHALSARPVILQCTASESVLQARINERSQSQSAVSEADVSVLRHQLSTMNAINATEKPYTIEIDTSQTIDFTSLAAQISPDTAIIFR